MIHVVHQRLRYRKDRTPGDISISGQHICFSLEDELREYPGIPVAQWKVKERTATPAGHYKLGLVDSPKFGKDTLSMIPTFDAGFHDLRIHGGNDEDDTEGCPLMGSELDDDDKIPGGKSKPGLRALRDILVPALKAGEEVIWEIRNPTGYNGPIIVTTAADEETLPPIKKRRPV